MQVSILLRNVGISSILLKQQLYNRAPLAVQLLSSFQVYHFEMSILLAALVFVVGSHSMPVDDILPDILPVLTMQDDHNHYDYIQSTILKIPIKGHTDSQNGAITWTECTDLCTKCGIVPKNENGALCVCAAKSNEQLECISESIREIRRKGLIYEVINKFERNDGPHESFLKELHEDDHLNLEELRKKLDQDNARDERCLGLLGSTPRQLGSTRSSLQSILGQGLRTNITIAERASEFRKRVEALRSQSVLGLRAQADEKDIADSEIKAHEEPQPSLPVSPFLDKTLGSETPKEMKDLVQSTDGMNEEVLGKSNLEDLPQKVDEVIVSLTPEQGSTLSQTYDGAKIPAEEEIIPVGSPQQKSSDSFLLPDLKDKLNVNVDLHSLRDRILRSPNPSILSSLIPKPTAQSLTLSNTRTFGRGLSHHS